jgi:hypothetical protein
MTTSSALTERQRFWLEHLRACGSGSLKAYAEEHGLEIGALYEAKSRLKRKGMLEAAPARFARVRCDSREPSLTVCRVHLRNGTLVEVACAPEHWPRLLDSVAALP